MDKISVIVPVYNAEKYLDQCIQSILNQTYSNVELVLVNDGSTDGSYSICQKYADTHKNIKLINKKNAGHSEARNTGLQYATGEKVTFVDDDDFIDKDYLTHLSDQMKKYNSDIACTCYYMYNEEKNNFIFLVGKDSDLSILEGSHKGYEWALLRFDYQKLLGVYVAPWCKLYKRSLWKGIWFPHNRKLAEDDHTTWKVFLRANTVSFDGKSDYCWRRHSGELSSAYQDNDTRKLYQQFELEQLKALEEQMAVLAAMGKDISPFRETYRDWVIIATDRARKYGDYENYEKLKFRKSLLLNEK